MKSDYKEQKKIDKILAETTTSRPMQQISQNQDQGQNQSGNTILNKEQTRELLSMLANKNGIRIGNKKSLKTIEDTL